MTTRTSPGVAGLQHPQLLGARYVSAQHSRGPEAAGRGASDTETARAVPGRRERDGASPTAGSWVLGSSRFQGGEM